MTKQSDKANWKVCLNCSARAALSRRVCPKCGRGTGKSFFREPTVEEIAVRDAERAELEATIRSLYDASNELVGSASVLVKAEQRTDVCPSNLDNYRGRFSVAQTLFGRAMDDLSTAVIEA